MCVCARVRVRVYMRVCVRPYACVRASICACVYVHASVYVCVQSSLKSGVRCTSVLARYI